MRESAHVCNIQRKSCAEITLHGKIQIVGIGSLQRSIEAAAEVGRTELLHGWYRLREAGSPRSGLEKAWRNHIDTRQPGQTVERQDWVAEIRRQTERVP